MKLFLQLTGLIIVLTALIDIYLTVLYARSGSGLLNPYINRGVWKLFRSVSLYFKSHRDAMLSYSGPTLLVVIALLWATLIILGFALIVWPVLGSSIQASQGQTPTDFVTALYYSGYNFTTLGAGNLVPQSGLYRLLMVLKSALGFSFFTLTITYFLSVYEALRRRNTFALSLHHKTGGTANPADYVYLLAVGGNFKDAKKEMTIFAGRLSEMHESHRFYPILHYFRFREIHYALPRIILITMDSVSLIRSALDEKMYKEVVHSVPVSELWSSGMNLLRALSESFPPSGDDIGTPSEKSIRQWRRHYHSLVRRLSEEGMATATDPETGADRYVALRRKWDPYVVASSDSMLYNAGEVMPSLQPDRDDTIH